MAAPQNQHEPAGNGFGLVHRVAQSPLGELWLALDQRRGPPGEPVLLRYVSLSGGATRDTLERVASAGRTAMGLRSELLLPVVEVLQRPLAVAYEYVEAQPLSVLQSSARARELHFPVSVCLRITADLLRALQTVHESWPGWPTEAPFGGLLPASVMVARDGRTRLCDALVASSALLQRGFDLSAAELAYRAPEQVYASTAPEPATDVFIAGILLWEMLSGRRLLSGRKETIERKLLEHDLPRATAELRSDVTLSRGLLELVNSGLALDPSQRPNTPGAFATALERCGHPIASHAEVAMFVHELAGAQLDRAANIVRLALGYAAGDEAVAQSEITAGPDLAAGPELTSSPSVAPPPPAAAPRPARPTVPPPPARVPSQPAAAPPPPPGADANRMLAAAVARALEARRASGEFPAFVPEQAPPAPRGTSLGLGPQPQARSAALAKEVAAGSTPRAAAQPPVQVQPTVPLVATVPPMPLLRRRAPAEAGAAPEPQPPSSRDDTTVPRAQTGVRSYTPPTEPIRLAPKRALLAAMASVVLLIQLWMFGLARSQLSRQEGDERPRLVLPDGPGISEQTPGAEASEEPPPADERPAAGGTPAERNPADGTNDTRRAAPEQ